MSGERDARNTQERTPGQMTRSEIATLAEPENFRPFVIVTAGGTRYSIDHPDYIDIPPVPDSEAGEETFPSYVTVYNRGSVARFIVLENIASIEFKPLPN
jgi:hypothetical protein